MEVAFQKSVWGSEANMHVKCLLKTFWEFWVDTQQLTERLVGQIEIVRRWQIKSSTRETREYFFVPLTISSPS